MVAVSQENAVPDTNDPILKDTRTWLAELRARVR